MSKQQKRILISVDVEEFDIPEEFGQQVSLQDKLEISRKGLQLTLDLFEKYNVRATFFITAYWAQHYPELIRRIAASHEVASHAYYHSTFSEADLEGSRLALQEISGQQVKGFRMPRLRKVNMAALQSAGYLYDSSVNPTWLPGRYNNWHLPRTLFKDQDVWIIPSSVSPLLRYPIFWLSVKNAPLWVTKHFSRQILRKDPYLSFYFHPWELVDLKSWQLPGYIKNVSGQKMYARLDGFLSFLQQRGEFCAHIDLLASEKNN
ncbi:polysaccharide deacetylase family protein [Chitinophaga sp. Cy-1792]|uniref:polysaccharide deacetylase family protein n=1 Tax=Chitinophaga sp. Cy-1792 TaxID=2608339 RepID=UPI001422883B|nr:polysaccharide deacetylase family protein [Chitinophaga sp. Cy-1792]NIG56980.1 polysaccharide deacetylase family protein [Chitinophaga sp. Cy-1792]